MGPGLLSLDCATSRRAGLVGECVLPGRPASWALPLACARALSRRVGRPRWPQFAQLAAARARRASACAPLVLERAAIPRTLADQRRLKGENLLALSLIGAPAKSWHVSDARARTQGRVRAVGRRRRHASAKLGDTFLQLSAAEQQIPLGRRK